MVDGDGLTLVGGLAEFFPKSPAASSARWYLGFEKEKAFLFCMGYKLSQLHTGRLFGRCLRACTVSAHQYSFTYLHRPSHPCPIPD